MEEYMKILKQENITNKVKINYLENWVIKQHDLIEDLNQKVSRPEKNGILFKETSDSQNLHTEVL